MAADEKPEEPTLSAEMERFAAQLAKDMQKGEVPFAQKIDAFKALTAYYSASAKKKPTGTGSENDDDLPAPRSDFQALRRSIKVVGEDEHGSTVEASGSR